MVAELDFSNKSVVITGASRGIGFGIAEAFASHGADLHLISSGKTIHEAGAKLTKMTEASVKTYQCDISDKHKVVEVLSEIETIDVLINNAGLERPTPINNPDPQVIDDFERIININILGTFYVTRAAVTKMSAGGSIIITSSIWGKTAVSEFSAYCSSKHANIGFMRSLSKELGPEGIRVNAVCPGWVETEAAMKSLAWMSHKTKISEPELLDEIVGSQSLTGLMQPSDVSQLYLYLASSLSSNITGQAINVDRGEVLG